MKTLNDPIRMSDETEDRPWSPRLGLIRAAVWGAVAAVVLGLLLTPLAVYAPTFLLHWLVRMVLGFGITWVMFGVVQQAAGMVGARCTALALGYAALVLVSQHVVFAICGVQTLDGMVAGWQWLAPATLGVCNFSAGIAAGGCAYLCHDGAADAGLLGWLLTRRVRRWL
jgi:hypothetical protein